MAAILIVEDDPDILIVLGRKMGRIAPAIACRSVADGPSALAVLEREAITLVLTDVSLPGMSGIALAKEIQARWPTISIVLISGLNPVWLAQTAQQLRVAGALAKPFQMDQLRAIVPPLLP